MSQFNVHRNKKITSTEITHRSKETNRRAINIEKLQRNIKIIRKFPNKCYPSHKKAFLAQRLY